MSGPGPAAAARRRGGGLSSVAGLVCGIIGALASGSCTDAELRCLSASCDQTLSLVDDAVVAEGSVCTSPPSTSSYPYKVVLVVDVSGSNAKSDPRGGRGRAVRAAFAQFKDNPQVMFSVLTFASRPAWAQKAFTRDPALLEAAAAQVDGLRDATDYLTTLQEVRQAIEADAKATDPSERLFTQYDVQWLSDGNPEVDPIVPAQGLGADDPNLRKHCAQTRPQMVAAVAGLMALPARLGFFSLTLSTIYLTGSFDTPCAPLIALDPARWGLGPDYLQDMAKAGNGSYQALSADELSFHIKVNTITRKFEQHAFYLVNFSRVVRDERLWADSDQDGLSDDQEQRLGSDPLARSAANACADGVRQLAGSNAAACDAACTNAAATVGGTLAPQADEDGDGLLNCEEQILGSDSALGDSDGDNLGDDLEVRFATNPLDAATTTLDSDRDGVTDRAEIYAGTDPFTPQSSDALAYHYLPLQPLPPDANGADCWGFEVDNVRLVTPQSTAQAAAGDNLICLILVERTTDSPTGPATVRRACKKASLTQGGDGTTIKQPSDGRLRFVPDDFADVSCSGGRCSGPQAAGAATTSQTTLP